ncbi:MAG: VOC family protein [Peptostreptococcaceae bacterium]|nr:VOC family protein [Peptostreptococcaceae bacterium]
MKVNIFLNFDGCAEEAFRLYERAFGTKIKSIFRVKDSPMKDDFPAEAQESVLWMDMELGGVSLYGEDLQFFSCTGKVAPPDRSRYPGQFISIDLQTKEQVDDICTVLSEGGRVLTPGNKTFFSEYYCRLIDRYGVGWELML